MWINWVITFLQPYEFDIYLTVLFIEPLYLTKCSCSRDITIFALFFNNTFIVVNHLTPNYPDSISSCCLFLLFILERRSSCSFSLSKSFIFYSVLVSSSHVSSIATKFYFSSCLVFSMFSRFPKIVWFDI